jgi:hypothetical protein
MLRQLLTRISRAIAPVSIGLSTAAVLTDTWAAPWSAQTKEKESDSLLGATADERDVADNLRNWRAGSLLDKLARADSGDISADRRVIVVLGITGMPLPPAIVQYTVYFQTNVIMHLYRRGEEQHV